MILHILNSSTKSWNELNITLVFAITKVTQGNSREKFTKNQVWISSTLLMVQKIMNIQQNLELSTITLST